ncbi:TPA: hypothetical protein HA239_06105 [Candidatus Woesearchaeota archaeon]|nr:hypothetical protein QT06_C0001G1322 [archaeon GW2011_AR15]MBS3104220.1 ATP-binding protein [Candidatus Woesearchaeota archaeon]HIH41949.1 hypothetical protein [Candidatus Woesearchaeota archaeon]
MDTKLLAEYQKIIKHVPPELAPREEIQNMQDAKSSRLEIIVGFTSIRSENIVYPFVMYNDNGIGMDYSVLKENYLVLFSSTKDKDFTQTGKYGIGTMCKLGLDWKYTIVNTTPKFGEKKDWTEMGIPKGETPVYRLVFTDNNPQKNFPRIEQYIFTKEDFWSSEGTKGVIPENFGTSIMQMFNPIPSDREDKFVESVLGVIQRWTSKIEAPLYFGVIPFDPRKEEGEGWEFLDINNDDKGFADDGQGYRSYKIVSGPKPEFVRLNIAASHESELDRIIAKLVSPEFRGVVPEGFRSLSRYGWRSQAFFNPKMILAHKDKVDGSYRAKLLDALDSIRLDKEFNGTKISMVIGKETKEHTAIEVRNKGILLWEGKEKDLPSSNITIYIDSPMIHHDLTREGIAREGEKGKQYKTILQQIPEMEKRLYTKFFEAIDASKEKPVLPLSPDIAVAALELVTSIDSRVKQGSAMGPFRNRLAVKIISPDFYKNRIRQKAIRLVGSYTNSLAYESKFIPLAESQEAKSCSLDDLIRVRKEFGCIFTEGQEDNTGIAKKLGEYSIPVIKAGTQHARKLGSMGIFNFESSENINGLFFIPNQIEPTDREEKFLDYLVRQLPFDYVRFADFTASGSIEYEKILVASGNGGGEMYYKGNGNWNNISRELFASVGKEGRLIEGRQRTLFINYNDERNRRFISLSNAGHPGRAAKMYSKILKLEYGVK